MVIFEGSNPFSGAIMYFHGLINKEIMQYLCIFFYTILCNKLHNYSIYTVQYHYILYNLVMLYSMYNRMCVGCD